jgi:hypothetical protein
MAELKQLADAQGKTVFALVDDLLREAIERVQAAPRGFNMGRELVDVTDRNALYDMFDRESGLLPCTDPPRS